METTKEDKVNHPSHYTWLKDLCGIEVIDITRHMNFNLGNCIKYVLRAGHKSEEGYTEKDKTIEDLEKAIFYIKDEINFILFFKILEKYKDLYFDNEILSILSDKRNKKLLIK